MKKIFSDTRSTFQGRKVIGSGGDDGVGLIWVLDLTCGLDLVIRSWTRA